MRTTIVLLLGLFIAVPLAGQQPAPAPGFDAEGRLVQQKSPATARLISLVFPGGGHLYAEETVKGLAILALSGGAIGYSVAKSESCETTSGMEICERDEDLLIAGLAVAGVAWAYGLVDSGLAAGRYNRRNSLQARLVPTILPTTTSGLKIAWRIPIAN